MIKTMMVSGLLMFAMLCAGMPADSTATWTPAYMVGLSSIEATAISPDGNLIAYTVRETKMEGEDSKYEFQIWLTDRKGSFHRQFTRIDGGVSAAVFSPDGKHISFKAKKDKHQQIFLIPVDGGESYPISKAENSIGAFKWSPDGKQIAFTMSDPETEEDKKNKKEKRDVILVDKQHKYARLYTLDVASGDIKKLYEMDAHTTAFNWSPDGKQIVFSHQPSPKVNDRYNQDISMVPADSGAVVSLINQTGPDENPIFSKDGQSVIFLSAGGNKEAVGLSDFYVLNLADKKVRSLPHTHDRSPNLLGMDKDGRLLYTEYEGTSLHLFALSTQAKAYTKLSKQTGISSRFSLSHDGAHLSLTYENSDMPKEVFVTSVGNYAPVQITQFGKGLDLPAHGKTELITWKSKDGMEIEGLLTYPVNYKAGDKVPLILMVHGGPAGVYAQSWTGAGGIYAIQYFAANGYALLRPNPRGSTGYGKDFRYANVRDWGYGDYEDLMSGVDKVIDMGVADEKNLFEMGWSYGGYMTSWIVTQTDRFNAVSMGAGLSNLVSMVGTTDIPDYLLGHMEGPYWGGNWEIYQRHSAIYFVDQTKTPTQIIHGTEDDRVPLGQAQEFYWALQELEVPSEMILYPRTPHGPREPKFTADVSERIMLWFEQYKK